MRWLYLICFHITVCFGCLSKFNKFVDYGAVVHGKGLTSCSFEGENIHTEVGMTLTSCHALEQKYGYSLELYFTSMVGCVVALTQPPNSYEPPQYYPPQEPWQDL